MSAQKPTQWLSTTIAVLALVATTSNVLVSHSSYSLNQSAQREALFSQIQQQYNAVSANFPPQMLEPDFHPPRNSDAYRRLENYWIFCYGQWFATKKSGSTVFITLWQDYYSELVLSALEIPSLRYVLVDMFTNYGVGHRSMQEFYADLRALAQTGGVQLAPAPAANTR